MKTSFVFLVFAFLLTACGKHSGHDRPWDIPRAEASDTQLPAIWFDELAGIDSVAVHSGDSIFYVVARTPTMTNHPCASCHTSDFLPVPTDSPAGRRAHWNITLEHADTKTMVCGTCHDYSAMSKLRTVNGESVELNRSFEMCGSCHFAQRRDWEEGSHGKRVRSWQGPRLIQNCASCHNPHRPQIGSRFPVAHPTIDERTTR